METLSTFATQNGKDRIRSRRRPLRMVTYLAPNLFWFYEFISRYLARELGCPTELVLGSDYAQLREGAGLAFICGLPYVDHTRLGAPLFEPLVAPVLIGERYQDKPIYFSDVIVRADSSFRSFADLRGRSWAFNEPLSQSGYGITRYHLAQQGETNGYFGRIVEAGYHERAIQMVHAGEVDASAIDSHVLALVLRDEPALAGNLRIIDTFGPSPIQPIVAGVHLSKSLRSEVEKLLLEMPDDSHAKSHLNRALIKRFEPVSDSTYDAIRRMQAIAEAARFHTLR